MRNVKRLLAGLSISILLMVAGAWFYLRSLQTDYGREFQMPGLKSSVEVLYDSHAVPHIYASNEDDLFLAFGYVHAQDRLFQMEVIRRLADGRLAEVFGEKAIASDRFFRTMSFREHAKASVALMMREPEKPYVKAAMAYLKGINLFIETGNTPVEFTIAGIPKTPFTAEDMEIIVSYMGYTFTGAFRTEAVATKIASNFGSDHLNDILSNWPDSAYRIPVQASEGLFASSASATLTAMANRITDIESGLPYPAYKGSNGWLISGKKTRSGKPILSNDTHIAFSQPSVWYEARLSCPGFSIYGNFIAGTPVPALGHSEKGGWGITMFENDDMDFYREKPNPADSNKVWYKDHWEDLSIRKETIRVKGKPDVSIDVKKSRHGYIMNGAFDGIRDVKEPIAMWWVRDRFPSTHLQLFYDLSHASVASEAAKAVELLTSPGLNIMWADTAGNIAWWAAGKLPVRPAHVNPNLILDGSTGADDPTGWLPFSRNPQMLNPASGVIYTANNQPEDMGSGLVPGYYVPSNRARRIEELLYNDKDDWTEESLRTVINDVTSTTNPAVIASLLPATDKTKLTPEANRILDILVRWDGRHGLEDIGPTVYYRLLYHLYRDMLLDELGHEDFRSFSHTLGLKRNTSALLRNDRSGWWDDKSTKPVETRTQIVTQAFNKAAADLGRQLGTDTAAWQWKHVHVIEHKHPLGVLPLVGRFFNVGPFPVPGGQETINNLDFPLDSTGIYRVVSGPALRRIIDFGKAGERFSVNPTGQSGHFMSPYYDDQAIMFNDGGKRPELLDRKSVEKVMIGKTVMRP